MLLPDEVRPFLLHEDGDVREHALRYFVEAADPSPATAEDVWAALDRFPASRPELIRRLDHFPHAGAAAERLLSELQRCRKEERPALVRALQSLHIDAARRALDDAEALSRLRGDAVAALRERVELAGRTAEETLKEIGVLSSKLDAARSPRSEDVRRAHQLSRALAEHHPEKAAAWAADVVLAPGAESEDSGWRVALALRVFCDLPFPGPIPRLFDFISDEAGDYDCEYADDALARLGTADVVRAIEGQFFQRDWVFRLYTSDALACIKRPESEQALIRLLDDAPDDISTFIAMGLCELCTTSRQTLDNLCAMVLHDDYDPSVVELDDLLLTAGKMVGWSPPDEAAWREAKERREMERREQEDDRARAPRAHFLPHVPAHKPLVFVPYGKKAKKKRK